MRDTSLLQLADQPWSYQVELLSEARVTDAGIVHQSGGGSRLLEWPRVRRALSAEVGEPEGVRTIIFDLLLERTQDPKANTFMVCRLDAEPGEEAMEVARSLAAGLGPEVATPSIKSLAIEGTPSCWYPDLEEFEAAAVETFTSK